MTCLSKPIIFYDGVCGLCNGFNRFVLKRDARDCFRFASLQSAFAHQALARHQVDPTVLSTVCVVLNHGLPEEQLLAQSDAVIYVLRSLTRFWRIIGSLLHFVPGQIRNTVYELVARNRYRLFGKHEVCLLPSPTYRHRFIDL